MTSNTVIQFPGVKVRNRLPETDEELQLAIKNNKAILCDEIVSSTFGALGAELTIQGYPMDDEEYFRDFISVGELLRAFLYKGAGIEHPLQVYLDQIRGELKIAFQTTMYEDDFED